MPEAHCPCCHRQIVAIDDAGHVDFYPHRHELWCPDRDDDEKWTITEGEVQG